MTKIVSLVVLLASFSLAANAQYFQKGRVGVGLEYGLPFPAAPDIFKDIFEDDWSGNVHLRYGLSERFSVQLDYDHFEYNDQAGDKIGVHDENLTLNLLTKLNSAGSRWNPFFSIGAGAIKLVDGDEDYTRVVAKAGLGIEYYLTRKIALGLTTDYHYVINEKEEYFDKKYRGILNPTVSLAYFFGGSNGPDADKDGVEDKGDKCPGTAMGASVDGNGCSMDQKDSDNDGISDAKDKCEGTPQDEASDSNGCAPSQKDTDNDGVNDKLDRCPNTDSGNVVNSAGCTEKEKVEVTVNIQFKSGKADIDDKYKDELEKVAMFLKTYADTQAEIEGHTDSKGNPKTNMKLSQMRADAVKNYLVEKFAVDGSRLSAKGYGSEKSIADNKTEAGRKQNRRVIATFTTMAAKKK